MNGENVKDASLIDVKRRIVELFTEYGLNPSSDYELLVTDIMYVVETTYNRDLARVVEGFTNGRQRTVGEWREMVDIVHVDQI